MLSSLKKKKKKKKRKKKGERKKEKDRKSNRRRLQLLFPALAKMDPRFIFNHARPRPICLVYSAERTGLGGDHYLDTQLTNEARLGRRRCRRSWKAAWISFLCPQPRHAAKAASDCQIARCCGHANLHRPAAGGKNC